MDLPAHEPEREIAQERDGRGPESRSRKAGTECSQSNSKYGRRRPEHTVRSPRSIDSGDVKSVTRRNPVRSYVTAAIREKGYSQAPASSSPPLEPL